MPLDDLSPLGRWAYLSGGAGTVTIAAGTAVLSFWCHATTAGSLVITPAGANQTGVAGSTITIPANTTFGPFGMAGQLDSGTTFVFTGTDSYFIQVHTLVSGAAAVLTKGF